MGKRSQHGADPFVSEIGERALVEAIVRRLPTGPAVLLGPGDDAAVISAPSGQVVVTTDTLIEGPDFRREWSGPYDLGWKSAAVNLSDVAAMGARPTALFVALALPKDVRVSFVEALADGFRAACEALAPGCAVAGGDVTTSSVLTVAVTALGDCGELSPVRRSGARVGDVVAVAGELGLSARGLDVLFSRFDGRALVRSELSAREAEAVDAQLRPQPPIGLGPMAARYGATAMMDISDGLALDATRMADASEVTIALEKTALGEDQHRALYGGEDHALLATFPAEILPPGFRAIGKILPREAHALLCEGTPIPARGWDPYRDADAAGSAHHNEVSP